MYSKVSYSYVLEKVLKSAILVILRLLLLLLFKDIMFYSRENMTFDLDRRKVLLGTSSLERVHESKVTLTIDKEKRQMPSRAGHSLYDSR